MSRSLTRARWGSDGAILAPRQAVAAVLHRNPEMVSRHCVPVACDVRSRALLYDAEEAERVLSKVRKVSKSSGQLRKSSVA